MKSKSIQTLLVIAISSFIVIFPAYLRYADLSEIDLSSTDLIFENPDQDDQINDQQHECSAPVLSSSSTTLPERPHLSNSFSSLLIEESFGNIKTFVLRC